MIPFRQNHPQPKLLLLLLFHWWTSLLHLHYDNNSDYPFSFMLVTAKEVEATNEWTLLGENDTVAAGMHIRMDLETGQKWVKLPDDDDDGDNDNNDNNNDNSATAQVTANGGVVLVSENNSEKEEEEQEAIRAGHSNKSQQQQQQQQQELLQYDFDMMHRTLSKLPDEDKVQMQLPELPGGTTASLSPQERAQFEKRMSTIWKKRQEQLRKFEQELVADMPEILKDRIQRIQMYLQDPVQQLRDMDLDKNDDDNDNNNNNIDSVGNTDIIDNKKATTLTHIVSVLKDLEYHLTDLDMTRDFLTMGGWNLLVSLISDEAHNSVTQNATLTDDLWDKVHTVQAHAAWALGTAVKNTGEFAPFALAPVEVDILTTKGGGPNKDDHQETLQKMSALDLVLKQYATAKDKGESPASRLKSHKLLYALGALLRGNRHAQGHFSRAGGPSLLGDKLVSALEDTALSMDARKTVQRLLSLADDIVSDVKLHPGESKQMDAAIVRGFATPVWCDTSLATLQLDSVPVQEKALRMIHTFASDCKWDKTLVSTSLENFRVAWEAGAEERDQDFHNELLRVLDSVMQLIGLQ